MGYGYFYFENNSDTQLTVSVELKGDRGFIYGYPYENHEKPTIIVAPGSCEALYWHNPDRSSELTSYNLVTKFTDVSPESITALKGDKKGESRQVDGQDVGYTVYVLRVEDGEVWIWENTSET